MGIDTPEKVDGGYWVHARLWVPADWVDRSERITDEALRKASAAYGELLNRNPPKYTSADVAVISTYQNICRRLATEKTRP